MITSPIDETRVEHFAALWDSRYHHDLVMSNIREMTGRGFLGMMFLRGLMGLAITIALVYAVDAAILRFRADTNRNAFGTVTVRPYFAVDRKDKKTEYMFEDPKDETCVNSLFPHLGDSPCWYVRRHTDEEIPN